MSESRQVVEFAEMARQAVEAMNPEKAEVMAWLGDMEQVVRGRLPAAVFLSYCPNCRGTKTHLVQLLGNYDQYVCQACGCRHGEQLTTKRQE